MCKRFTNWSIVAERSSLYRTQVLVLAVKCGFESRPWHLCPWARHLIIIASLHPGLNGYLWGQSWLISPGPICAVMAAIELYTPQGADEMVSGMMYEPYEQGNAPWAPLSWWIRALYKSTYYYYYYYLCELLGRSGSMVHICQPCTWQQQNMELWGQIKVGNAHPWFDNKRNILNLIPRE